VLLGGSMSSNGSKGVGWRGLGFGLGFGRMPDGPGVSVEMGSRETGGIEATATLGADKMSSSVADVESNRAHCVRTI